MMNEQLGDGVVLHSGDCLEMLKTLDENSVDACVTDPPYGLAFMGKHWDHGVPGVVFWREVIRVLKPGAHIVAFGGTRTYHRLAVSIEDAGFEIRDMISWLYGSGFPKSLDVSKAIDKAAGAEREVVGEDRYAARRPNGRAGNEVYDVDNRTEWLATSPATDAARQWQGFGTALKPACEPIVLARKPLSEPNVAANVLKWGTGALNIDDCRVATAPGDYASGGNNDLTGTGWGHKDSTRTGQHALGRFPANVIHDGSDEVTREFPETTSGAWNGNRNAAKFSGVYNPLQGANEDGHAGDSGSAARFFYSAKADKDDRLGSKHPTVKPLDLMQYLVRLATPPRGLVLDCFAGTGTTGEACIREHMRCILIEREEEYQEDIRRRMKLVRSSRTERKRATASRKKETDIGPLFK